MPSQSELANDDVVQDFYQEVQEAAEESGGALKTKNPENNKFQREYLHLSDEASAFRRTLRMILCMHGWDSPEHKRPMTLLVVTVHLAVHDIKGGFKSINLWASFADHTEKGKTFEDDAQASPRVVAWAPFVNTARFNETEASIAIKKKWAVEMNVGAESGPAKVEVKPSVEKEKEMEYKREFFDAGKSDPMVNEKTGTTYGVNFFFKNNELQANGDIDFTIAILIERNKDSKDAQPYFKGRFDSRLRAGSLQDFGQGVQRALRTVGLMKPEDDDVFFDPLYPKPEKPVQTRGPEGERLAEFLRSNDIGENMATLRTGDMLTALCSVPGLEPTVKPKPDSD